MARFRYLTRDDLAPEHRDILRDVNISRILCHSPNAARHMRALAMYIRFETKLDPRLRELAIIQVGYSTRCEYEYLHHIDLARGVGCSDDDILAVAAESAGQPTGLEPAARAVLAAAREMTLDLAVGDATFAELQKHFDNERLMDLLITIASYNSTVRLLCSFRIDLETDHDYAALRARFPLPAA